MSEKQRLTPPGRLNPGPACSLGRDTSAVGTQVIRYSERPELWSDTGTITQEVWPEYNLHSEDPHGYWDRLLDAFEEFQFVLFDDETDEVIAEGHTIPCVWDFTPAGSGSCTRFTLDQSRTPRTMGLSAPTRAPSTLGI